MSYLRLSVLFCDGSVRISSGSAGIAERLRILQAAQTLYVVLATRYSSHLSPALSSHSIGSVPVGMIRVESNVRRAHRKRSELELSKYEYGRDCVLQFTAPVGIPTTY